MSRNLSARSGSYNDIIHNNIANIVNSECSVSLSNITENRIEMQDSNLSQPFSTNSAAISSGTTAFATSVGLIIYLKKRNK